MLWFLGTSLSAEHAGSTLQRKKGTVAIQSAFIGKSAYSRKNTSADSSACASLTCESRAYSVILQQKGAAQQGTAVYLTAFHMHPAPPAKALSLFTHQKSKEDTENYSYFTLYSPGALSCCRNVSHLHIMRQVPGELKSGCSPGLKKY